MQLPRIALALVLVAGAAQAAPVAISGLYSTGVDAASNALADGAVDPHYVLAFNPDPGGSANALALPLSNDWVPEDAHSGWIGPASSMVPNCFPCSNQGLFIYNLTFSLAGLNAGTANVAGSWAADDAGARIFLNGVDTGIVYGQPAYGSLASFVINSGFIAGDNILSFVVSNSGEGNTGLLVRSLSGAADVAAVPLPASMWLLVSGLLALVAVGRRRAIHPFA